MLFYKYINKMQIIYAYCIAPNKQAHIIYTIENTFNL